MKSTVKDQGIEVRGLVRKSADKRIIEMLAETNKVYSTFDARAQYLVLLSWFLL